MKQLSRKPGEFLKEEKEKTIKEFSKVSTKMIVDCTENLLQNFEGAQSLSAPLID